MFGDERARAKEVSLFLMRLQGTGFSGFRDNETGDARAYVQSPNLRLLQNSGHFGCLGVVMVLNISLVSPVAEKGAIIFYNPLQCAC